MYIYIYQEHHFHVHYPKAVILGDNGKIVLGKNKRKKSSESLHLEIQPQQLVSLFQFSINSIDEITYLTLLFGI